MTFIINAIEDIILVYFIANYINIYQKRKFILIMFLLCFIETSIFDIINIHSWPLPIILITTLILGISYFNKKISYSDIISCCFGLSLIVVSNLLALFIIGLCTNIKLTQISLFPDYFKLSTLISKLILLFLAIGVLSISKKLKSFLYIKDWWTLIPIWFLLFSTLFIIGYSIIFDIFNLMTIYILLLLLIALTILMLILYFQIQKKNIERQKMELEIQKSNYIKKNKEIINKLHNEITVIDHYNMYVLLHTKILIQNKQYKEANIFLDKNIHKLKRYKNVINTGQPIFDYEINKLINKLILADGNIKTTIHSITADIDKDNLKIICEVISHLFAIANKQKVFNIQISETFSYILVSISFYETVSSKTGVFEEIEILLRNNSTDYRINKEHDFYIFNLILEVT